MVGLLRYCLAFLLLVPTACGSTTTAPAEPEADHASERAATGDHCPGVVADGPGTRAVAGADRACSVDADCVTVQIDCSHLRCTGVGNAHAAAYEAPIDCTGFDGPVGNYDCRPRFGAERPACIEGCCVSERLIGRASAEEACDAIAGTYTADSCTVFGPTFSAAQCLSDVAEIRADADEADLRRLAVGLDCARGVASCAQIEFCVAQFRSSGG